LAAGALVLLLVGLWWVRRQATPAAASAERDESASPRPAPSADEPASRPAPPRIPTLALPPAVDPCVGLQLLDIEAAADGRVAGVWLRNDIAGPSLVRPGEKLGSSKLVRVVADRPSAQLWFEHAAAPCEVTLVPSIDLAKAVASAVPGSRWYRDPTEHQGSLRNPARRGAALFGIRSGPVSPGGTLMRATIDAQPAL
jgi:hypothetical protein